MNPHQQGYASHGGGGKPSVGGTRFQIDPYNQFSTGIGGLNRLAGGGGTGPPSVVGGPYHGDGTESVLGDLQPSAGAGGGVPSRGFSVDDDMVDSADKLKKLFVDAKAFQQQALHIGMEMQVRERQLKKIRDEIMELERQKKMCDDKALMILKEARNIETTIRTSLYSNLGDGQ